MRRLGFTEDYREGVAAFLEKRQAELHRAMIISFAHEFVFTAVPKTGTHAVRQALREHLGPQDIEQVGLFVQKEFPIPELAELKHGHISLQQLRPHLSARQFETFLRIVPWHNHRLILFILLILLLIGALPRWGHSTQLGLRPVGILGLILIVIVILLLLGQNLQRARLLRKAPGRRASIGTRLAISAACAWLAVPSITRFLMPWTMPARRKRL